MNLKYPGNYRDTGRSRRCHAESAKTGRSNLLVLNYRLLLSVETRNNLGKKCAYLVALFGIAGFAVGLEDVSWTPLRFAVAVLREVTRAAGLTADRPACPQSTLSPTTTQAGGLDVAAGARGTVGPGTQTTSGHVTALLNILRASFTES